MTSRREQDTVKTMPASFPSNVAAERSTLGAILLRPALMETAISAGLAAEHFSVSANATIYSTLLRMHNTGQAVDTLLLCEELDVSSVGGRAYLCDLASDAIPVETHVLERCRIIQRNAGLRKLLLIAERIESAARQRKALPHDIADNAMRELMALTSVESVKA